MNLADNRLTSSAIDQLMAALRANEILQVLLLRGNPGVADEEGRGTNGGRLTGLYHTIVSRLGEGEAQDGVGKEGEVVTGYMRINLLPPRVGWLLRVWRELLYDEAMGSGKAADKGVEKAYSGLDFCLEPTLTEGPRGGGRGKGEGDGLSYDNGEAVLYEIGEGDGRAGGTTKLVHTPFHDYLFSSEGGAVQGALVSSLDISDEGAGFEDVEELEDDLGVPSSHSKLDNHPPIDWEYWPAEEKNERGSSQNNRSASFHYYLLVAIIRRI